MFCQFVLTVLNGVYKASGDKVNYNCLHVSELGQNRLTLLSLELNVAFLHRFTQVLNRIY